MKGLRSSSRTHADWFSVDMEKLAAMARSRTLGQNLKELVANALDAGGTHIAISCKQGQARGRDRFGLRAYQVTCTDNGHGCPDPEILRTIGSTMNDLHPETRGRFGQGLIDVLAACESAEIRTLQHRLVFDDTGCVIMRARKAIAGLAIEGILRHPGDGFQELGEFFRSIIVPAGVELVFNGEQVAHRPIVRRIENVALQTVVYDVKKGRDRKFLRETAIELVGEATREPMIHELGLPVDVVPWSLPYDINVLQKTPLDAERNLLPEAYKGSLVRNLVQKVSDLYGSFIDDRHEVPPEIRNDGQNAVQLDRPIQDKVIEIVVGAKLQNIVRENPFDPHNDSEAEELKQRRGKKPVNTGTLPDGIRSLVKDTPTVAALHDELCKVHFRAGVLPPETDLQRDCLRMFSELRSALLERHVACERMTSGTIAATWNADTISLNTDIPHLWNDPLGEQSVALILHECAHCKVSGHSLQFQDEIARLGGKLAGWVAANGPWWATWQRKFYDRAPDFHQPDEIERVVS